LLAVAVLDTMEAVVLVVIKQVAQPLLLVEPV
jgi:hypothetical protein